MNKVILKIIPGIVLVAFLTSCLKSKIEESDPTFEEEQLILANYIDTLIAGGHNVDTTDLGVYYVVLEEGDGDYARTGDTLSVGYSGYFVDGTLFDTSQYNNSEGSFQFILGGVSLIPGWEDAMKVMNKNAKIQFVIPSELAYGSTGQGTIPPYTTLVFVIKMLDIKPRFRT